MNKTRRILSELSELLGRYGYDERSAFVARLATETDPDRFWQTAAGPEFWGGSGAVWEVAPFKFTHPEAEAPVADYRRFQLLMIELADRLESRGMSRLSARNASLFRRQLEEGS